MALVKCKECGHEVSNKGKTCPQCGAPMPEPTSLLTWLFLGLLGLFVIKAILTPDSTQSTGQPALAASSKQSTKPKKNPASQKLDYAKPVYTTPESNERAGWTPADENLSSCVIREARRGSYSSLDGGESAGAILADKCSKQWLAWIKECQESGSTKQGCVAKSAVIAQTALMLAGK